MDTNISSNICDNENLDEYRKYDSLTDEELIVQIKEKTDACALDYLIHKYRKIRTDI